jgi:hypothetical protein
MLDFKAWLGWVPERVDARVYGAGAVTFGRASLASLKGAEEAIGKLEKGSHSAANIAILHPASAPSLESA